MTPHHPHVASRTVPSNGQIPDPPFGGLDAAIIQSVLGEAYLQAARWASFAQAQAQTIAALRERIEVLEAQIADAIPVPSPDGTEGSRVGDASLPGATG